METATEAVRLFESLPSNNRNLPGSALALNTLANCHSAKGDDKEALHVALQSLGIYRGLAEQDSRAYEADFAMALSNAGSRLKAHRQAKGALDHLH